MRQTSLEQERASLQAVNFKAAAEKVAHSAAGEIAVHLVETSARLAATSMNTERCVDQAVACIAEAKADPARAYYWIEEAV